MSFDTDFDYTNIIASITTNSTRAQTALNDITVRVNALVNVVGYGDVTSTQLQRLNELVTRYTNIISTNNAYLANINSLLALDPTQKNTLYCFYQCLGTDKQRYMCSIINNYTAMLADTHLCNIICCAHNSSESKTVVATILYSQYPNQLIGIL